MIRKLFAIAFLASLFLPSIEAAEVRGDGWYDSTLYPGWQFLLKNGQAVDWRRPEKPRVIPAPQPDRPEPEVKPLYSIEADECDPKLHAFCVPSDRRRWYHNPDGSCVQCSIGMCGVDQNYAFASTLLWDTEYGKKERGGSWPGRVARYAESRGMRIYNVTGADNTFDWMKWACRNGRGCAIGAGSSHFQTLVGYDPNAGRWMVCNNNSTSKIDVYDESGFRRLHMASGPWIVILDVPPHPAVAEYVEWWK